MTGLVLPALAVIVAGLLLLGPVAWIGSPRLADRGALVLSAVGAALALLFLILGAAPATIAVPFGLPGSGLLLALDGLSAPLLALLFTIAAAAAAAGHDAAPDTAAPLRPLLLGALAATLLAADGFSLVLAVAASGVAGFALTLGTSRAVVVAVLCLTAAVGLLAPLQSWGIDLSFAGMRAQPPDGWRAAAVLGLTVLGAVAALAPAAPAAPAAVLRHAAGAVVALYVAIRLLFDLCGPAQPGWWGVPLLLLGAAGALLAALRAAVAPDLATVLAFAARAPSGLAAVGIGVALAARAADLPALAALALGAALLLMIAQGVTLALLLLGAGAIAASAGTDALDRLGGLAVRMPVIAGGLLLGAASLAALPPGPGFVAAWTLLQALLAGLRIGGLAMQALVAVAVLAVALAMALTAAAMLRLVGIACLGQPRSAEAAAVVAGGRRTQLAMLALAASGLWVGLFPGTVLLWLGPALRLTTGAGLADRAGLLVVAPQADAPGYQAATLAGLLVLALVAVVRLRSWRAPLHARRAPVWDDGFAPAQRGAPTLQYGSDLTQPLRHTFAALLHDRRPGLARLLRRMLRQRRRVLGAAEREGAALVLGAVMLLLLAAALAERL